jgi:NAD(P)-dependent dehydrogenase (short-subunit alcohol dehydrogenase family)
MSQRLVNKHVLLTGGSGGIGRYLLQGLLREGAAVTVMDIQSAEEAFALAGSDKARFEKCDLSDGDEIRASVARAERSAGGIDMLVHCAAHQPRRPFEEIPVAQWRRTLSVNLDALFHLAQAVVPNMKKRAWGRIVSFTSTTFNEGTPEHLDYVSSKAGIIGATRVLAKELGKHGITVNAISPGLVKTQTAAKAVDEMVAMGYPNYFDMYVTQQSLKRNLVPQDMVGPLIFLLSDEAAAISGQTLLVDGGKEHS